MHCRTSRPSPSSYRATRLAAGLASAHRSNTPVEIIDKLNKEIDAGVADPKMKARLADLGIALTGSPSDFGKLIVEETENGARR